MTMKTLLSIRDLSVALPPGGDREFAVKHVSLEVPAGQTVCVVGESGSGKSVMANAVMRLLPPSLRVTGGQMTLSGEDILSLDAESLRRMRGSRMGMIFQEPMTALNPVMTVGDQIDEVLLVHGERDAAKRERRVLELMREMSLPEPETLRHRYPFQLSGGQRQRVVIAIAMALEPQLLIADEPTTALDVTTQAQILALVKRLQVTHGIGVLFITHDFGVVADIADRVVVMQQGTVVETGRADQVLRHPEHPYTRRLIDAVPRLRDATDDADTAPRPAPLLRIEHVSKSYRARGIGFFGGRGRTQALQDVSLEIGEGETVGLIGESGSGKTTLGQCVMRLLDVDQGRIVFNGVEIQDLRGRALKAMRPQIQMIFQDPFASLNPRHRVGRIVTENAILCGVPPAEADRRMQEVLKVVGLDSGAVNRYPHEFSGGQRQRIGIARALVMQPRLIVADEAVSALDVSVQQQVLALLREVRERLGLAMLFITHDLRVASQLCDRIAVMHKGRVVETGTVQSVARAPAHPYTRSLFEAMPGQSWERDDALPELAVA